MAMSKAEKNARARARYAELKAAGAPKGYTRKGAVAEYDPYRYPTPKHGPRYGGEHKQVGLIGPARPPKKRGAKAPPAAKKGTAPPMVRKAVARIAGAVKTKVPFL